MASGKGFCVVYFFIAFSISALMWMPALVVCDDHIVGANHGWQVPSLSGVDLNYSTWASQQTFYLGDFISFHYQKGLHTVYEVNKTTYENCDFNNNKTEEWDNNTKSKYAENMSAAASTRSDDEKVVHNWSTKGGRSIVPLNESRTYYFACGLADHCLLGMKLAIDVLSLPSSHISNATHLSPSSTSSSASLPYNFHLLILLHLLLVLILSLL